MSSRRIRPEFASVAGGLFTTVTKADVGGGTEDLIRSGHRLMSWADPLFPDPLLPAAVSRALTEAIATGVGGHYTMPIGSGALREAIAAKLRTVNGIAADPERNVLVTPGSDSGLFYALMPLLGAGDEALVPEPSYPNNALDATLLGATPVFVPLDPANGFQLDVPAMRAAWTPRTRVVILTHPNNPTATVYRREVLEELARFITEKDLYLVCDQAFEDHIFDGIEFVSPATLAGMAERTVTVFSFSKGFGLSGLRVGYLSAPDWLMDKYYGAAVNVLGATSTLGQLAAEVALASRTSLAELTARFDARRRYLFDSLSRIPGVAVTLPESGFLSWLDVHALGSSGEVAARLRTEAKVLVNEGEPYGPSGAGHLRVVQGVLGDDAEFKAAVDAIAGVLAQG